MIFTDRFVYVHEPKTGGTFVTHVLRRIHFGERESTEAKPQTSSRFSLKLLPRRSRESHPHQATYGTLTIGEHKHATASEIPPEHRDKVILATVRNPYDLYVSEFEFGWWRKPSFRKDFRDLPGFHTTYSHFPNLSFEEYVRFINPDPEKVYLRPDGTPAPGVGAFSKRFVKFYCKSPQDALRRLGDGYIASEQYREDLYEIRFIATDRLNEELYRFLLEMGYREPDIAFIPDLGRIRPSDSRRGDDQRWEEYYTPELKRLVRERERMLFTLFPQFDL